jgi:hypothetical protein
MRARDHIGNDFLVGVPEMRLAIDVINRGRDVESLAHVLRSLADDQQVGNCGPDPGVGWREIAIGKTELESRQPGGVCHGHKSLGSVDLIYCVFAE